ncbi:DUF5994 family protein [Cryptosporangium minutisporangium]|uniref:Uncharacterized protein n=1 Tax=Cryptosporangium minutisporangium TaxID=113569 RepID=A0ABP6T2F3_9ACTN
MAADEERIRLTLNAERAGDGVLDGAWWPRTRNPLVEFPLLVAELAAAVGAVTRISLSGTGWLTTPRTVPFDQSRIEICWFSPIDSHEVVVLANNAIELDLLLVPPATAPIAALAAMTAATRGHSAARGSELLATHGVPAGTRRGIVE